MLLGLTSAETYRSNNFVAASDRRRVFYEYPNGAAPLIGLLSMMEEENTDNSQFGWFEKRFKMPRTTLGSIGVGDGAWSPTGSDTAIASPFNMVAGTVYRMVVADSSEFRVSDSVWIQDHLITAGTGHIKGIVTEIVSATKIEIRAAQAVTGVTNDVDTHTPVLITLGTAYAEGSNSGTGKYTLPVNPSNYTQIFKSAFSFTSTALKHPTTFDRTGAYKDKAKENLISHMVGMEYAFLFGTRRYNTVTTVDSEVVQETLTGGILWFLEQWELGNVANGGAFDYRPSGSYDSTDVSGAADSHDLKRVIENTTGTISKREWDDILKKAFDRTNDRSHEKICLCGAGFLKAVNEMFESYSMTTKNYPATETYGMNVTTQETPFGTLHFKTHPLFTRDPSLQYSGFIIDMQNLNYRPLNDRDTILLKNLQANDADRRKDQWLTEAGLEIDYPESCMFIRNLQRIT